MKRFLTLLIATIFTYNFIFAQRNSNFMPASTIKIQSVIGRPGQIPLGIMVASLPHEELLKTTTFFQGDSLSGFSYETTAQQLEKDGYKLIGEFSAMMYRAQKSFVKNKYNISSFPYETTKKTYTPPLILASSCNNLDFEDGNFNTWIITSGINQNSNGNLTLMGSGFSSTDQNIYSCNDVNLITGAYGNDPIGFPGLYPSGGSYSARIGGFNINASDGYGFGCAGSHWTNLSYANGEVIEKSYTVTTANDLLSYNYAVVLNDGGHPYGSQPYFHVYVKDLAGNILTSCTQYYVQAATGMPPAGFSNSGFVNTFDNSIFYYKNWTSSSINLSAYIGQTVKVSFVTAGCTAGAHPGWAYVDATCASAQIISSNNSSNLPCAGSTITLTAPAVQGGSYSWSGPGIVGLTNGQSVTVNIGGTYSVTVTPSQGSACAYTLSANITFNSPIIASASSTAAGCSLNNGTATVNASGGTPNYTYLWTPGGQTSQTSTGLSSGNYNVTVSDANGCTNTATISVTSANGPTVTASTLNNVSCNGGNNGSATATASGGTPNYTYQWSNGQTTSTATGLTAGTHIVTVTDANNCSFVTTISVTQPNILAVVTTQNNIACNGGNNGSATATPSGGSPGYTYTWSNGQTTSIATGLSAATYSVTVMDAHSCTQTSIVTITQPASLTVSAGSNQNINSGQNVTMIAGVSGGTSSYNYLWSNSATTQSITANPSATITFSVTVTDARGCSANSAVTIFVNVIPVTPTFSCSVSSYTTTDSVVWFSFVAASPYTQITVVSPPLGGSSPHIHELTLYSGSTILEDENFPLIHGAQEIEIDASGLTVGATYHLKASRSPGGVGCPSVTIQGAVCGCTSGATFSLAIRSLNVIATNDFGSELSAISHSYYTNKGQIVDLNHTPRFDIKAYTANASPAVYNSDTVTSFVFAHVDTIASTPDTLQRVDMSLVGASSSCGHNFKTEKISSYLNYFLGHVPTGATDIKGYSRIVKNDVYRNIDMQLYSNSTGVKFYFVVRPSGNADTIVLNFAGADAVQVTGSGGLHIATSIGNLDFDTPYAYQLNSSGNVVPMSWQAKFIQVSSTSVKFNIGSYTTTKPLFIQVDRGHVLNSVQGADWSTYSGGNAIDQGIDVITDNNADVYVAGYTTSTDFPVTPGAFQTTNPGNEDGFIGKFSKDAVQIWTTYYGGSQNDRVNGITYANGNIFITGRTASSNFPPLNAYDNSFGGVADAFVAKLNTSTGFPVWSTYFGGCADETGRDIAADGSGNVYIVGGVYGGSCSPPNLFPLINPGGGAYFQNIHGLPVSSINYQDGFIAKFNNAGTPVWSTYYGGGFDDIIKSVAIDPVTNNVCVTGDMSSQTQRLTPPCLATNNDAFCLCDPGNTYFQELPNNTSGSHAAFVSRFSSIGNLLWSSLFIGPDESNSIAVNPQGDIYIAGETSNNIPSNVNCGVPTNTGFPLCNPWQGTHGGGLTDIFISRFNPTNNLTFSTYYGGNSAEGGNTGVDKKTKLITDLYGDVFVTGVTTKYASTETFPTLAHSPLYYQQNNAKDLTNSSTGSRDAFVLWFDSNNKLQWATQYGGGDIGTSTPGDEVSTGIAFSNAKALYIVGGSTSLAFPQTCPTPVSGTPYCQPTNASPLNEDGFIVRFDMSAVGLGITDNETASNDILLIYPNPNSGEFFYELKNNTHETIILDLYNSLGQVIYSKQYKTIAQEKIHLDFPLLADGIYLLSVKQGENIVSKKFIVQK